MKHSSEADHAPSRLPQALKTFNLSTLRKRFGAERRYETQQRGRPRAELPAV